MALIIADFSIKLHKNNPLFNAEKAFLRKLLRYKLFNKQKLCNWNETLKAEEGIQSESFFNKIRPLLFNSLLSVVF